MTPPTGADAEALFDGVLVRRGLEVADSAGALVPGCADPVLGVAVVMESMGAVEVAAGLEADAEAVLAAGSGEEPQAAVTAVRVTVAAAIARTENRWRRWVVVMLAFL